MIDNYFSHTGLLEIAKDAKIRIGFVDSPTILAIYGSASNEPRNVKLAAQEVFIVEDIGDFDYFYQAGSVVFVVGQAGVDLLVELVECGKLSGERSIVWDLGLPLWESWQYLSSMRILQSCAVDDVRLEDGHAIVSTSVKAGTADSVSFGLGFLAGQVVSSGHGEASVKYGMIKDELTILAQKHLSLLEALGSAPLVSQWRGQGAPLPQNDIQGLKNELVGLNRQHDALKRKYASLSKSKLGSLTLKIWDIRKRSAHGVVREIKEN